MRVFIIAGSPSARKPAGLAPRGEDRVIAADLGAHHALRWGWPVHLLVGDFDSLAPEALRVAERAGAPVVRSPAAKDQTDTELAVAHAMAWQPDEVVICGALGGRTDHLLANVLLLAHPALAAADARLADGAETVRLLSAAGETKRLVLAGAAGDLLSLLPIGVDAEGVSTHGLRYPLHHETLYSGEARGVSNVFDAPQVEVTLRRGRLICVHNSIGE